MRTKHIIDIIALIISVTAIVIAYFQNEKTNDIIRKANEIEQSNLNLTEKVRQLDSADKRISHIPILQFDFINKYDESAIYLENAGLGPALIVELHSFYNEKEFGSWYDLNNLVEKDDSYFNDDGFPTFYNSDEKISIGPGQRKELIGLKSCCDDAVSSVLESVKVDVTYVNLYSDTFHVSKYPY